MEVDEPEEALLLASDLFACGANGSGQLGTSDCDARAAPSRVRGRRPWLAVALGDSHAAAVSADGGLYSWGLNDRGQLGAGDTSSRRTPCRVEALSQPCSAVACGYEHTAALTSESDLFTFGSSEYGACGCGDASLVLLPRLVQMPRADRRVLAVACGAHHTLALTAPGALYAWGQGAAGCLGTGDLEDRRSPTPVGGLWGVLCTSIAAGATHSLAVSCSGAAYAWGRASGGVLGLTEGEEEEAEVDMAPCRPAPAAVVAALVDQGFEVSEAERSASATHSVEDAVDWALQHKQARGGAARGVTRGVHPLPRRLTRSCGGARLPPLRSCAAGSAHSVLVALDGGVYTCGGGGGGCLGHGGQANELQPRRIEAVSLRGRTVVAAACGASHTLLLCSDGAAFGFGSGEEGALGGGDARDKAVPFAVLLPAPATALAAGGASSAFICPLLLQAPHAPAEAGRELAAALEAAEVAVGAAADERAVRSVSAALAAAVGSVRGVAAAFMRPPAPPGLPACAVVEALSVRALGLGLRCGEVVTALRDAAARLAAELEVGWRQAHCEEHAAAVCTLLQLPLLSTERLATPLLRTLLPLLASPPPPLRAHLLTAWAAMPAALLASRTLRPLQAFLTAELRASGSTTPNCVAAIRTLALLDEANRRRAEPVDPAEWYNEFVSSHFNAQEDFALWSNGAAAFTFCAHPFLLSQVAKARLLRFEAALRMTRTVEEARSQHAAQQALAFTLPPESPRWMRFLAGELGSPAEQTPPHRAARAPSAQSAESSPPVGCGIPATLPDWCVLRVRRSHLVADALEEVARQHPADLFKPLRVHFIGEEGVDAGGLKKGACSEGRCFAHLSLSVQSSSLYSSTR